MNTPLAEFKPLCSIKMNNLRVDALIDSGNLVTNVISEDFAHRLFETKNLTKYLEPSKTFSRLGTAQQGAVLDVLGVVKRPVHIRFGGSSARFPSHPLVIRGLSSDVNISGPFLMKNQLDQLHSSGELLVRGQKIPLKTKSSPRRRTAPKSSRTYLAEEINLSPQQIHTISVRIPAAENQLWNQPTVLFQGCPHLLDKKNVFAPREVITEVTSNGECTTSVANFSDHPVKLPAGTYLGDVYPVKPKYLFPSPDQEPSPRPTTRQAKRQWLTDEFKLQEAPWLLDSPAELTKALDIMMDFYDIFSHDDEYGKTNWVQHRIHTGDALPVRQKHRPLNPLRQDDFKNQFLNWKKQEVIEASDSPWSSALLAVPKKNGKTRWCIDYRDLNKVTTKDSHPLPVIADNLARLSSSKVFSAIDGAGAFHAIRIHPEDKHKTAFSSPFGDRKSVV